MHSAKENSHVFHADTPQAPDDHSSGRINAGSVLLSSARIIAAGEGSLHVVLAADGSVRLHLFGATTRVFQKRGIDLDISRGFGSLAAIQAVSTGQFDIGGAQTGAILLSIIKGENLRLAATQGYDATLGILVPEKNPIRTPKDLEGKKIGVTPTSADTPFLPAYCRLAGVDFDKLNIVQVDSKILEQAAMSGVVDAILVTGLSSVPNFVSENIPFRMLPYSHVGLHFIGRTPS